MKLRVWLDRGGGMKSTASFNVCQVAGDKSEHASQHSWPTAEGGGVWYLFMLLKICQANTNPPDYRRCDNKLSCISIPPDAWCMQCVGYENWSGWFNVRAPHDAVFIPWQLEDTSSSHYCPNKPLAAKVGPGVRLPRNRYCPVNW